MSSSSSPGKCQDSTLKLAITTSFQIFFYSQSMIIFPSHQTLTSVLERALYLFHSFMMLYQILRLHNIKCDISIFTNDEPRGAEGSECDLYVM
jgi:hypothetical protein